MTNRKPKAASSPVRHWEEGEPLSFAWWGCASWEDRKKYQACDIDFATHVLSPRDAIPSFRRHHQWQTGRMGLSRRRTSGRRTVLIPAHLFPRDREDTADIDWSASSLRSSGHSFVRIRVAKPQIATLRKKRPLFPKSSRPSRRSPPARDANAGDRPPSDAKKDGATVGREASEGGYPNARRGRQT